MATAATIDVELRANTARYRQGMLEASRIANRNLGMIQREAKSAATSLENLNRAAAGFIGFRALQSGIGSLLQAQKSIQQIHYGLQGALGSSAAAADAFSFVSQKAKELGLNIESAATDFTKLTASATALGVPMREQQELFDGFARAAAVMHLSTDQMRFSLMGLSQMFGKGRIQAEELRRQIGEQIPGFVPRFMKAVEEMNEGTELAGESFDKLLEGGKLATDRFMPALIQAFQESGRGAEEAAKGLNAELNRLSNSWYELKVETSSGLFNDAAITSIRLMHENLSALANTATLAAGVIGARVVGMGLAAGAGGLAGIVAQTQATAALTAARVAENEQAVVAAAIRARESAQAKQLAAQRLAGATTQRELNLATNAYTRAATAAARANATYQASLVGLRNAQAASTAAQTAATTRGIVAGAAGAVGRGALALVGGPWGAATLAVGALGYAYLDMKRKAEDARREFEAQVDSLGTLRYMIRDTADQLRNGSAPLNQSIEQWARYGKEVRDRQSDIAELERRIESYQRQIEYSRSSMSEGAALGLPSQYRQLEEAQEQLRRLRAEASPAVQEFKRLEDALRDALDPELFEAMRQAALRADDATLEKLRGEIDDVRWAAIQAENALREMHAGVQGDVWKLQVERLRRDRGEFAAAMAELGREFRDAFGAKTFSEAWEKASPGQRRRFIQTRELLRQEIALNEASRERQKTDRDGAKLASQRESQYQAVIDRIQRQIALDKEAMLLTDDMTAAQRLQVVVNNEMASAKNKLSEEEQKRVRVLLDEAVAQGQARAAMDEAKRAAESMLQLQRQLNEAYRSRQMENEAELFGVGHGSEATERMRRLVEIQEEYQRQVELLNQKIASDPSRAAAYQAELAELKAHKDRMLEQEAEYQRRLAEMQGDWTAGANRAFEDYLEGARNTAQQTYDMLSGAFQGAEDAWVKFTTTGKTSFSEFANSVVADLARIAYQRAFMAMFGGGGEHTGTIFTLFGGKWGFSQGGYTGPGGVHQPAGVVHRGEVVWSQKDVARAGGVAAVEAMRLGLRGYARGGAVGPQVPVSRGAGNMKVEIVNNGSPARVESASMTQQPDGTQLLRLVLGAVADDVASGGRTAAAMKGRFGLREVV